MPAETVTAARRAPEWAVRAAVLSVFDIEWMTPVLGLDPAGQEELAAFLDAACERVIDGRGAPRWQLREGERTRVLRETPRRVLQAALASASDRSDDPVQAALTRYVDGTPAVLDELDTAGLRAELQLGRWVGSAGRTGDEVAAGIKARLDWLTVTEPLRRLLARGFFGRRDLMAECRAWIAGPPRQWPFLIEGVGGSGKSSLLARLILDLPGPDDVAVYISFDRGWLLDAGPPAIFDELLHQIGAQRISDGDRIAELRRKLQRQQDRGEDIASRSSQAVTGVSVELLREFRRLSSPKGKIVVVFDTLEELARRDEALVNEIYEFVTMLMRIVPSVTTFGVGRAVPWTPDGPESVRRLTGLEAPDALELMRTLTAGTGVADDTLREVIALVSGNPLSLRLAADVLNRTGDDPAQLIAVTEGNVQGQLYARLLEHIGDPRVRALAHPGLVVRRITPTIIREVLAGPCEIGPLDQAGAVQIFQGLREEATLCEPSPDGDDALVHRQDVRAIMLPAIARDRPAITRRIHRAAVDYYRSATAEAVAGGSAAAASRQIWQREELYHRLMLGQPREELDRCWQQAVATDLVAVFDEFPESSRLYLTTKVRGLRLDEAARAAADDYEWQQAARSAATRLMERGQTREALALICERRAADGRSLLPDLEIEALERLGRNRDALTLARAEQERVVRDSDIDQLRGLIVQQARILERLHEWAAAWDLLADLAAIDAQRRARRLPADPVDDEVRIGELIVLSSMLRVARKERRPRDRLRRSLRVVGSILGFSDRYRRRHRERPVAELTRQAKDLAEATPQRVLAANASLLRDLAAELGSSSTQILELAGLAPGSGSAEETVGDLSVLVPATGVLAITFSRVPTTVAAWLWTRLRALFRRSAVRQYQIESDAAQSSTDGAHPMSISYRGVQLSVGVIALLLPYVLTVGIVIIGRPLPASLGDFYYTPLRDIMVCTLGAFAVLLLGYSGYDVPDSILTNSAGAAAIGFALCPTAPSLRTTATQRLVGDLHNEFGVFLFVLLGLMALRFAKSRSTPPGLTFTRRLAYGLGFTPPQYGTARMSSGARVIYRLCGIAILSCTVLASSVPLDPSLADAGWRPALILQWTALTGVGVAWLVKGRASLRAVTRPNLAPRLP